MKKVFSQFIRRTIRNEILWKAFWIVLWMSIFIFFWLLSRSNAVVSNISLYMMCVVLLFVLFITIPRWRKYYLAYYNYASNFADVLEIRTKDLTDALKHLNQNPLLKEIFWLNFKIDPATLKIELETHSAKEEPLSNFEDIRNKIEALITVKESTITDIRKKGWGAEDNIEFSLEMIRIWLSYSWNHVQLQKLKVRSTISIKDRSGYFNMTNNKWEEQAFLS